MRRGAPAGFGGLVVLAMSAVGCRFLTGGSSTRRFKPDLVKKLIQECLAEKLTGEKYHVDKVWLPLALLTCPFCLPVGPQSPAGPKQHLTNSPHGDVCHSKRQRGNAAVFAMHLSSPL